MKRKYFLYPYQIREYLIYKKIHQVQMNAKYFMYVLYFFKYQW